MDNTYIDDNIIGKKFGRLTVIGEDARSGYYKVRCDCGKEKSVSKWNLEKGSTKSCGCLLRDVKREFMKNYHDIEGRNKAVSKGRMIDMTGKRIGHLTVIKRVNDIGERPRWLCKCDCGNEKIISGANLRSGKSNSCGSCKSFKAKADIHPGDRFGMLTVKNQVNAYKWFCVCDCGKPAVVSGLMLASGRTKSCGCGPKGRKAASKYSQDKSGGDGK